MREQLHLRKFGTLTEEVKTKISELDNKTLEGIIDGIFEFKSIDDVKNILNSRF